MQDLIELVHSRCSLRVLTTTTCVIHGFNGHEWTDDNIGDYGGLKYARRAGSYGDIYVVVADGFQPVHETQLHQLESGNNLI